MTNRGNPYPALVVLLLLFASLLGGSVFLIVQLARFLASVFRFLAEPNLLPRIMEGIGTCGLVCGGVVIFFVVLGVLDDILTPKYVDDSDDYHASR